MGEEETNKTKTEKILKAEKNEDIICKEMYL